MYLKDHIKENSPMVVINCRIPREIREFIDEVGKKKKWKIGKTITYMALYWKEKDPESVRVSVK